MEQGRAEISSRADLPPCLPTGTLERSGGAWEVEELDMDRPSPNASGATFDVEAEIVSLISKDAVKVPPYPAVAIRLGEFVRREDYSLQDIINVVSADQALAAEVIRCANSALYGRGEVTSLQQAVKRVGANEVVRLALVSGLAAATRAAGGLISLKRRVWQDGVASAVICQVLARGRGLKSDDAFLCGLLHDFGWVLGLATLEEILHQHPEVAARDEQSWRALVDRLHIELGMVLAARWNLPELFSDAISLHHEADYAQSAHAATIEVVALSDKVVALLAERPHISAADLSQQLLLKPGEAEKLAAAIPEIPGMIAAFEAEPAGKQPPSKVVAPETTVPEGFKPMVLPVSMISPRKKGPFNLSGIAPHGWVMSSREPLAENQLIEVEFQAQAAKVKLWGKITLCNAEGALFRLECKPFVLNANVLQQWNELNKKAVPAA
jgi:HD-like signal output (HDOD) protein